MSGRVFLFFPPNFFPLSLSPFLPCILFSRRGFSRPTPRRPVHLPSPGRIWCLFTGSSPSSRFPRRYASFGVMAVGTNGLTCGFNWHCTADTIGYAVMITARLDSLPSPHSLPRFGAHPGREAAGVQIGNRHMRCRNTPPALDIREGDTQQRVKRHPFEGKP